ncbi:hypothetical protein CDD83_7977 [Cordyceps sp. RAO-2017]|nr:hypothetical protein CDD83_7977 [Cordyceps sp. RAO-2017]
MPPRQKAAPAAPLGGCVIALSGRFNTKYGHSHASLEQLVRSLGATTTRTVGSGLVTHLVCTEHDYNEAASKVKAAQQLRAPLVQPEWVFACEERQTAVPAAAFLWEPTPGAGAGETKKRSVAADSDSGGGAERGRSPPAKKAKKSRAEEDGGEGGGDDAAAAEDSGKEMVAEGQFIRKKDAAIPLDDFCSLTTCQVYIEPETGMIYDASLNLSSTSTNHNKFYRLQVLHDASAGTFKTWTRWGRVGEAGQNAILGDGSLAAAVNNFEKKFRAKSGLAWSRRGDDAKAGKYAFVERSYDPDSDDEHDSGSGPGPTAPDGKGRQDEQQGAACTLEEPVRQLMELIFNQNYLEATMTSLNYDAGKLPLGKLSKTTITRGFQQLKDLAALLDDPGLAASRWGTTAAEAREQLSDAYYSVIPHAFGRRQPPVISSDGLLRRELELLESL